MAEKVVVRVPPSPTGKLHIGTARTMLFNYLFAKQHGGTILFRSEDTDTERSKREYEKDIISGLAWLGLAFDIETIYRQSEQTDTYERYIHKLLDGGHAYISKDKILGPNEPDERKPGFRSSEIRSEVIRFRNPNVKITFEDLVHGEITFDTTELKDFVIAKSLHEPLYHLAVVVDDIETGITHVIRGDDHISNTPRHILIQEALGAPRPIYAHIPLILMPDRSKMSKRKHGEAVSVGYYRERGYLPEAIINFLALLGWNPGRTRTNAELTRNHAEKEQEIFSLTELISAFDIKKVQKAGAIFNPEKLDWFNKHYIQKMSPDAQKTFVRNFLPERLRNKNIEPLVPIILDRIEKGSDVAEMAEAGELDYFFEAPLPSRELLLGKTDNKWEKLLKHIDNILELLSNITPAEFTAEKIKDALWDYASEQGRGNVLWPLRVALTGKEKSPDPFTVASIIGKEETISRLNHVKSL